MMKPTPNKAIETLRRRGFRLTPQRLAILQIIEEDGGHLAPVAIYERAVQRMPGLTEATVYRTLDFLARNGLALVAHVGDGRLVYETAAHNHHHLICRDCNVSVEIPHEQLNALYDHFREQTGFVIDVCHVTFFGRCPRCATEHARLAEVVAAGEQPTAEQPPADLTPSVQTPPAGED